MKKGMGRPAAAFTTGKVEVGTKGLSDGGGDCHPSHPGGAMRGLQ